MARSGTDKREIAMNRTRRKAEPGHWLSGNMAQLMVFMNGLIVSITAFAILNVFIGEIVKKGFDARTQIVHDYVEDRVGLLEKDLQHAASLVAFSGSLADERITQEFETGLKDRADLEQAYWLKRLETGQLSAIRMLKKQDTRASVELHKHVIKMVGDKTGAVIITDYKDTALSSLLIVAMSVDVHDKQGRDIVYTLAGFDKLVAEDYFKENPDIASLTVTGHDGGVPLFNYASDTGRDAEVFAQIPLSLSDNNLTLSLGYYLDQREAFLKKAPFLMLLFGVTLTLIGTLYVRNNQRQSMRLATMNRELETKNADMNREIVEREKLNLALRQSEKENRSIIDSVSDIIFETDTEGKILFLNRTWDKITGFSAERSLGRNIFDLFYMQDQAQQRTNFDALVKGQKQGYRAFTRLRTADGTFRAVELSVSMLRMDENNVMRVVGAITDVEERRRAERALSEAEKKYRAIVENAASGIYQVTPEGQYLSANPAMAKILMYDAPEDILREVHNANAEIYVDARARERHLIDAQRGGDQGTVEAQVRRRDGGIIWVQESLRAVKDDDGALLFYEGSIEDITQRKETELALRKAMVESDLASRSKSEFLANMSHELRTPLNAIIGFSDIIKSQAFGPVGAGEYLEYARDINDGGKRLLQVINDILDVSRVASGDRQLNEGLVDLGKIVASATEIVAPKVEASHIVLSSYITEDAPKLIGEAHAIKQMIINLLSNSIKYTPAGGRVSIAQQMDAEGQLHLSITDTGIGLTDSEIETALSPFGQVETNMDRADSGTGLGLTLVQSLMSLHGGSFELFSQKGIGTTATLVFPPKRVSAPKKPVATTTGDATLAANPVDHKDKV